MNTVVSSEPVSFSSFFLVRLGLGVLDLPIVEASGAVSPNTDMINEQYILQTKNTTMEIFRGYSSNVKGTIFRITYLQNDREHWCI